LSSERAGPVWAGLAAMAALGAAQSLAFVHTFAWALQLLCIAALAWQVQRSTPARAAAMAAAYASAWMASSVWWLFISMHRYGGLPAWTAALAVALLSIALAGYPAVAMALAARARSGRALADALRFALAWLAAELARGLLFTGFPWAASGYGQIDGPLAALAPWIGVYGIGAVAAALGAGLAGAGATAPARRHRRLAAVLGAAGIGWLVLAGAGPGSFTQPSGELSVSLLQPNVPQDEKFVAERLPATLDWVAQSLLAARGDLVVAPETAVPLLPDQLADLAPDYWPRLRSHFAEAGRPAALIGVPLGDPVAGYTNSVAGLGTGGAQYRYDKVHLVPFGEFVPPAFRWFTRMMNIPLGDFRRGDPATPSFKVRGVRALPNICYEDLFGEELAARFRPAERAPTLLVNLSNIGWFGDSPAPVQHLNISRMRAIELQRPMLRATNTGATAIIDHHGRVLASLPGFTRGVLTGRVQARSGHTPYVAWVSATGLWPLLAASWLGLLWSAFGWRRPARGH